MPQVCQIFTVIVCFCFIALSAQAGNDPDWFDRDLSPSDGHHWIVLLENDQLSPFSGLSVKRWERVNGTVAENLFNGDEGLEVFLATLEFNDPSFYGRLYVGRESVKKTESDEPLSEISQANKGSQFYLQILSADTRRVIFEVDLTQTVVDWRSEFDQFVDRLIESDPNNVFLQSDWEMLKQKGAYRILSKVRGIWASHYLLQRSQWLAEKKYIKYREKILEAVSLASLVSLGVIIFAPDRHQELGESARIVAGVIGAGLIPVYIYTESALEKARGLKDQLLLTAQAFEKWIKGPNIMRVDRRPGDLSVLKEHIKGRQRVSLQACQRFLAPNS